MIIKGAIDAITWALDAAKRAWNEFWSLGAYSPEAGMREDAAIQGLMENQGMTELEARKYLGLQARGGLIKYPGGLAIVGEKADELILPMNDMNRTADLLVSSGVAAKLGMGRGVTNNYSITVDGSKMPSADFNGLIESIQRAQRLQGVPS